MKKLSKKENLILFIIIELIFIILFFMSKNYLYKKEVLDIFPKDLYIRQGILDNEIFRIDETLNPSSEYFEGVCTYGPYISLKRGIYEITVDYSSSSNDNFFKLSSNEKNLSIIADKYPLFKNNRQVTYRFILKNKIDDLEIVSYYKNGSFTLNKFTIENNGLIFYKDLFIILLIFIFLDFFIYYRNSIISNKYIILWILLTTFITSLPIFMNEITNGIDLEFHINRIQGIYEGLIQGQFPVKIQSNWNHNNGYPVSIFYGDILLYIPAGLIFLIFVLKKSLKINMFP